MSAGGHNPVDDPKTRLARSSGDGSVTVDNLRALCEQHEIPHSVDFDRTLLPKKGMLALFMRCYQELLRPKNGVEVSLPETTLPELGESTIVVLETPSQNEKGKDKLHGEVVATIAKFVAEQLSQIASVIYLKTDIDLSYRTAFARHLADPVKKLLEHKGVAVFLSCVGWDDALLTFDALFQSREDGSLVENAANHCLNITGFVVDSAGNDGIWGRFVRLFQPFQKHVARHHAPLYAMVGAVEHRKNGAFIPGYSSANSPTFLAPVAWKAKIRWCVDKVLEPITGTSAAAPYAAGVLAALNKRYGAYLTREQILFALIATCDKVAQVSAFSPQTPAAYSIKYTPNFAGHTYNEGPGGFGEINPHNADHLLAHMVALTQKNSERITVPTAEFMKLTMRGNTKGADDLYHYTVTYPSGLALKTTFEAQFAPIVVMKDGKEVIVHEHGAITLTSPSGTTFPMIMSQLPMLNDATRPAISDAQKQYGMSSSHAWTGEDTGGEWHITSKTPISQLRLTHHHFQENDIISELTPEKIGELLQKPRPDLSHARPLIDLKPDLLRPVFMPVAAHPATVAVAA